MSHDGATRHMVTLESHCRTVGGATLVELCVTAARPRRVRIESCLEGAVWPPRTNGVPEPGWDERGFEGCVDPDTPLVLGYASPGAPADPPARIADEGEPADREPTPEAVVKALGRREPPRDAVLGGSAGSHSFDATEPDPDPSGCDGAGGGGSGDGEPFDAWFRAVERRLETAERLAAATSVTEAESAIERTGGIAAVRRLRERLQEDRVALDRLDRECSRVSERAEAVDVPVEALSRLV